MNREIDRDCAVFVRFTNSNEDIYAGFFVSLNSGSTERRIVLI